MSSSLRASSSTLNASPSVRTVRVHSPPPVPSVITSPPWAKDEPPSPTDEHPGFADTHHATDSRSVASFQSTYASNSPSRWWAFTRPRGDSDAALDPSNMVPMQEKPERKSVSFKDRSMSWLPTQGGSTFPRRNRGQSMNRNWNLSITLPTPPASAFTQQHNATPGWDAPWTSRVGAQGPAGHHDLEDIEDEDEGSSPVDPDKHRTVWQRRRKRLRAFILSNAYVPLLFRCINILFTTTALAIAIRIRLIERRMHTMGELGSSPTLVIIFAPPTLVHVMSSIYLEYFGRPLGLWRTSAKLAHTLFEVLFICAWSAALSLSFDNFFTSVIPCTSASTISWYSTIPRPQSSDPVSGDKRCDDQLALICLVLFGLLAYCANLIISLYRIFEKIKYHNPAGGVRSMS
ncbi:hypothetical protein C8F04DRAFT_1220382 [Mycena alexandri]|uniref:Uncharacterized protein n=1 Tax=Mycena alexandri TaxID=1745969 RepID=A0AAD6X792_9AGAR|nr:hypothetical protein C8F04DRAFT_1220382 [Mycena alexandri]